MITLIGMLEVGWEEDFEHLVWRQLKGAWKVNLKLIGHHYETMEEALESHDGPKVFLIPPGRTESIDFKDYIPPNGDIAYIFGRPGDTLVKYIQEDDVVISIHTPGKTDMMAISVVGIILNECR